MIKRIFLLLPAILVMLAATGCIHQNIAALQEDAGKESLPAVDLDLDKIMADCKETLNEKDYPYGVYLDFAVHPNENSVELIWPLKKECTPEEAKQYAVAYIRAFNDACASQNLDIAISTDSFYGGYWEDNFIDLQIFYENDIMEPEHYLINQIIEPGSNAPITLQNGTDGEN